MSTLKKTFVPRSPLVISPFVQYYLRMPIYEFHCGKCERDSEILVRSSKWQGTRCPHCGSAKLSKKLSVFASAAGGDDAGPTCTGKPSSCGMCGTGRPHSH